MSFDEFKDWLRRSGDNIEDRPHRYTLLLELAAIVVGTFLLIQTCNQVKVAQNAITLARQSDSSSDAQADSTRVRTDRIISLTKDQIKQAKESSKRNDSITDKALRVSDISARAALKSALAADSSYSLNKSISIFNDSIAKLELRAYVNVVFSLLHQSDAQDTIYIPIINSGKTPAYYIRNLAFFHVTQMNKDDMDDIIQAVSLSKDGKTSINPPKGGNISNVDMVAFAGNNVIGIGQTETRVVVLKKDLLNRFPSDLTTKSRKLYFYSTTIYDDIFGRTHQTNFCIYWDNGKWSLWRKHNESD
jgi:hypothetical protein